jgi:putative ABC transport system permease protein
MIDLVLAMLWNRRGPAVILALLAVVGVAAAVAAPAYVHATDRAIAAGQVATALPGERGLVVSKVEDARDTTDGGDGLTFSTVGPALVTLPGFTTVHAAEYPAIGIEPDPRFRSRFVYRQDVCPHLTIAAGRCVIGEGEVVIGEQTARSRSLAPGDEVVVTFAAFSADPRKPVFVPDGRPQRMAVVGVYSVPDGTDPYWGTHGYFAADTVSRVGEPVFTNFATLTAMDHGETILSVDSTANQGALDIERLDELRTALAGLREITGKIGASVTVETSIPDLLARIDSGRAAAHVIVPVIAVPLILLSCLVIFMAVSYGTDARRPELAVLSLRGARRGQRWWLATGESLVAILVGALFGCLAGQLMVNAVAAALFPGAGVAPVWSSLRYAPVAAAAALSAALLAQRAQLRSSVAALLRRRPAGGHRAPILEVTLVLLAILAAAQLVTTGGDLTGAGLFAPALVLFALAVVAGRALMPIVTRGAARFLRHGRLGVALAGLQLSRRSGAHQLFLMLVTAVAVTGYAACAVDVGARDRTLQADFGTGAARVVAVRGGTAQDLLAVVRAVDPDGRFAMAVTRTPDGGADDPPVLAVDTTRLAAVASWADGEDAATVAQSLHPGAPRPTVIPGAEVAVAITASDLPQNASLRLGLAVSSTTGLGSTMVALGELRPGPVTYRQQVAQCSGGCRVDGISITTGDTTGVRGRLIVTGLGSVDPVAEALPAAQLADPARWRMDRFGSLSATPSGLGMDITAANGLPDGAWLQPVDTPYPLPVANAGRFDGDTITGLDGRRVAVARVAELPAVPRLGVRALLTDLEYADHAATAATIATTPEVWLTDDAPADIVDRLSAQGLVVTGDTRAVSVGDQLARQGPALALWFYAVAGVLATLLAAGALILAAAVDRPGRVEDLSALRAQGLSRPDADRATLWAYPILVFSGVMTGMGIALAGWRLTGWALPLAGPDPAPLPYAGWPRPLVLAAAALAVLIVLVGAALLSGQELRRRVRAVNVNRGAGR